MIRKFFDVTDKDDCIILSKIDFLEDFFGNYKIIYYEIINNNLYYLCYEYSYSLILIKIDMKTFEHKIIINISQYKNLEKHINEQFFIENKLLSKSNIVLSKNGIYTYNDNKIYLLKFPNNLDDITLENCVIEEIKILYDKPYLTIHKIMKSNDKILNNEGILSKKSNIIYIFDKYKKEHDYDIVDENFNIIFNIKLIHDKNYKTYVENNTLYIYYDKCYLNIKYFDDVFIITNYKFTIVCNKNKILSNYNYNYSDYMFDKNIAIEDCGKFILHNIINKKSYILPKFLENSGYDYYFINDEYILIKNSNNCKLIKVKLDDTNIYLNLIKVKYNEFNMNDSLLILENSLDNCDSEYCDLFIELLITKYDYNDILNKIYNDININPDNEKLKIIHKLFITFVLNNLKKSSNENILNNDSQICNIGRNYRRTAS